MNWSQTKAALVLTGGFSCAKADAEKTTSLLEFFAMSVAGTAPPCDGLEAVNGCVETSTISSTTAGPNDDSSAVKSQASWMCSIAVFMFIVITV